MSMPNLHSSLSLMYLIQKSHRIVRWIAEVTGTIIFKGNPRHLSTESRTRGALGSSEGKDGKQSNKNQSSS